mmetsp:Transcript_39259/g.45016  ORF Transcript_39259/g.45016 Transcript_39259/m.45016 type:complete len:82 (-) Transcript_39259:165-410(-)
MEANNHFDSSNSEDMQSNNFHDFMFRDQSPVRDLHEYGDYQDIYFERNYGFLDENNLFRQQKELKLDSIHSIEDPVPNDLG